MMKEKKFVKVFKSAKIVQLILLFIVELLYIVILIRYPALFKRISSDVTLYALFIITWAMLLFNLFFMLYDFYNLKLFAIETESLNRAAYMDNLTGIMNRHGLDTMFANRTTKESVATMGCCMFTIKNLLEINSLFGHERGDKLIKDFCNLLDKTGSSYGVVGRNSSNDFVIVIDACDEDLMKEVLSHLDSAVNEYNQTYSDSPILLSHAYIINNTEKLDSFTQVLSTAYKKLHF